MDAQEQDLDPELMEEAVEAAPPEAFYTALRNALKQLERQPTDAQLI